MTAAPASLAVPTCAQLETLAVEYLALKEKFLQSQSATSDLGTKLEEKAEVLRALAGRFGSAHAEKSRILHGIKHEIMVTFGQTVSVDAAAVENFRDALQQAKQTRLLKAIFQKTIRWTMQPQASEVIRGSKLTDRLRALAAKCEVIKPRTPTVTVRAKA